MSSERKLYRWCVVVAVALVPSIIKAVYYPHNIGSDDAYIHLRVATEFVRGLGWGINPHEPVNLSTGPAFTLLLAALLKWTAHAIGAAQMLSCAAVIAGLVMIFVAVLAETRSLRMAFFAEAIAAFSVNLWRWNGTLMEATFAFAAVSMVLLMVRRGRRQSLPDAAAMGFVLVIGMLLRPEIAMLAVPAVAVLAFRSTREARGRHVLVALSCAAILLAGWVLFAQSNGLSAIPTTFVAKSAHGLKLINPAVARSLTESFAESLGVTTAFALVLIMAGRREARDVNQDWVSYVLPVSWVVGLMAYYYLRTQWLESPGRYTLPLLPCEVMLFGLLWQRLEKPQWSFAMAAAMGLNAVFALVMNQLLIAPVLRRFEGEYAVAMRAAAGKLKEKTAGTVNKRVLVYTDIGVLSCAGDGAFEIFDGAALATPSLRNMRLQVQIEKVRPAFVVESQSETPAGAAAELPELLEKVWERQYRQQGVRVRTPYYYAIVFETPWSG